MDIDTGKIRRLRDALVEGGRLAATQVEVSGHNHDRHLAAVQRVSPMVEVMYLMMAIDADVGEDEHASIQGALKLLTDGMVSNAHLDGMLVDFETLARQEGVEARLQAIGNKICRDRLDRETAFSLAAAVAMADGKVAEEESLLVTSIAECFGISSRRCDELLSSF